MIQPNETEKEAVSLILKKEDFWKILQYFMLTKASFVQQLNKYFLDKQRRILGLPEGTTLRLRETSKGSKLQLKMVLPDGSKPEYSDSLLTEETDKIDDLLEHGKIFPGNVRTALMEAGINPDELEYLNEADTLRYSVDDNMIDDKHALWKSGKIFFDETTFPGGSEDYRIEVESEDMGLSQRIAESILAYFNLPFVPVASKVETVYEILGTRQ